MNDKTRGALLGLAAGDALGTTLEFKAKSTNRHRRMITDIVGGGPFNLPAGYYTDDTAMALALGDSLRKFGYNPRKQAEAYIAWRDEGRYSANGTCFDIGNTVSQALNQFIKRGNPYAGSTDPYSAGNGSIMRLAPIPIYFKDGADAVFYSGDQSKVTHAAPQAVSAAEYMGGLMFGALQGEDKTTLLAPGYHPVDGTWSAGNLHPTIETVAHGSFKTKTEAEIRGNGYVVNALEAALWAFYRSDNFRDGAILAVNLREDADTTGAIYGQIAGAYYGLENIPKHWQKTIRFADEIIALADDLTAAVPKYKQEKNA